MELKSLGKSVNQILKNKYPNAECALISNGDAWKLLVMARLSAQCTDKRVNDISKDLFVKYPTIQNFAEANIIELENAIRSCGLYKMKAKNIKDAANIIISDFNKKVPDTMEDLLKIPGVGRKIANLILGDCFNKPGIVADTHCIRICGRLGFYDEDKKDPLYTEKTMEKYIEKEEQSNFCHRLVQFGRDVCSSQHPKCSICELNTLCAHRKKSQQLEDNNGRKKQSTIR